MAAARPRPDLLLGGAEQADLKIVDVFFHFLEMSSPEIGLLGANPLFTLPAHAMKQQGAVRRDEASATGSEDKQRRGRALAQYDRSTFELSVPHQRQHRQG